MNKQYLVIYNENGMDVFSGTYDECQNYIKSYVVDKLHEDPDEYSIEPDVE